MKPLIVRFVESLRTRRLEVTPDEFALLKKACASDEDEQFKHRGLLLENPMPLMGIEVIVVDE